MNYRLAATDIDGTLIDDNRQISGYTARTIKKAVKDGLLFTIATGRSLCSITQFIDEFEISCPAYYQQRRKNCHARRRSPLFTRHETGIRNTDLAYRNR